MSNGAHLEERGGDGRVAHAVQVDAPRAPWVEEEAEAAERRGGVDQLELVLAHAARLRRTDMDER